MLFDWLHGTFIHPLIGAHPAIQGLLFTVAGFGFMYSVWRLWAFTVKPALHPDEPKELPYWIPVLGAIMCCGFSLFNHLKRRKV
ncbi:MAG: hypothetical protein Q9157_002953 [Trypethelium eluteriae]